MSDPTTRSGLTGSSLVDDYLESVRQALEWWEAHLGETGPVSNDLHRLNQIVLADAAGRLVRLAETGQRIEWCETHGSVNVDGYCEAFHDDASSGRWDRKHFDDVIARRFGACRIVSKWLSDYTEETS